MNRLRKTILLWVVVLAALLWICSDLILGKATVPWDAMDVFQPSFLLLADFIRHGQFMLWNPWINAGSPEWIEPQLGAFSPIMLSIGLVFGSTPTSFHFYFLLIWWLSGLGAYVLARRFHVPPLGAIVLGFAWIFSGFSMGNAQHVPWLFSMAWLPFEILVLEQALEKGSWRKFALMGVLWGFSILGGHPGVAMNNWLLLTFWALGRSLFPTGACIWDPLPLRMRLLRLLMGLGLAGILGLLLFSPNIVGMLWEAVGVTRRSGALPRAEVVEFDPLSPLCLFTLGNSYLGSLPPKHLWPATDVSMANIYIGVPALVFAFLALFQERKRIRLGLFCGAIFFFMVALGPSLPLRGWLYDFVFFTRYQHHPAMYRGQAMMLLMVLSMLGARDWIQGRIRRGHPTIFAMILGSISIAAFFSLCSLAQVRPPSLATTHLFLAWGGTLLAFTIKDALPSQRHTWVTSLWSGILLVTVIGDGYLTYALARGNREQSPAIVDFLKSLAKHHRFTLDLTQLSGFHRTLRVDPHGAISPFSGWSGVFKKPAYYGYTAIINSFHERLVKVPEEHVISTGNRQIWFSQTPQSIPPSDEALEIYIERWKKDHNAPLLLHQSQDFQKKRYPPVDVRRQVIQTEAMIPLPPRLLVYQPSSLKFEVDAPSVGWILVTDRWSRSWKSMVNGKEVAVRPANFYFRAVPVQRGKNVVSMTYEPKVVPITLLLSWGTLALVLGWQVVSRRAEKKAKADCRTGAATTYDP